MSNDNHGRREQPMGQPSPDLTHLHPAYLHIGHIGVFAGDSAWMGNPPRIPGGFVDDSLIRSSLIRAMAAKLPAGADLTTFRRVAIGVPDAGRSPQDLWVRRSAPADGSNPREIGVGLHRAFDR